MGKARLPLLECCLLEEISRSNNFEGLWDACLKTVRHIEFDYYSYRIQCATPLINPKVSVYGNFPIATFAILPRQCIHVVSGSFNINAKHSLALKCAQRGSVDWAIKENDVMFYMARSMPMLEGGADSLTLVRAHRKIEKLELKVLRVITNIMFDNIRRKVIELKGGCTYGVNLSPREKEVLLWGADGKTSEEIAIILGVTKDTVNFHFKTLQKKMGATNRVQAIAYAIVKGYIK